MTKKYISLSKLSKFLDNLKETFAPLFHKHTISDITDFTIDKELSSTSTNPVANKTVNTGFSIVGNSISSLQTAVSGKADTNHNHDDKYYTESEIDSKLDTKSDKSHNHDSAYETKTDAQSKFNSAKSYTTTEINKLNDRISNIIAVDESTEGNTELIDIRTGIDGTKYPTAGDAVREQIGQLDRKSVV